MLSFIEKTKLAAKCHVLEILIVFFFLVNITIAIVDCKCCTDVPLHRFMASPKNVFFLKKLGTFIVHFI